MPDASKDSPPDIGGVARSAGVVALEATRIVSDHPALRAPLLFQEGSCALDLSFSQPVRLEFLDAVEIELQLIVMDQPTKN